MPSRCTEKLFDACLTSTITHSNIAQAFALEIRILDSTGNVERTIPVTDPSSIRDCRRYSLSIDSRQTIALKESVFARGGIGVS